MSQDPGEAPPPAWQQDVDLARRLILERRWLDAQQLLVSLHQRHPEAVEVRGELARVLLALGEPSRARLLAEPCIEQGITAPVLIGLFWRARVREAASSLEATALVAQAIQQGGLPEDLLEEWRMITAGLISAGWHSDARAWLQALGSAALSLPQQSYWRRSSPQADDPGLDLDAISAEMVLHPAPELQARALQFNRRISETWLEALPKPAPVRPGPRRHWLICGNRALSQCWLYRVEQKRQQLQALGCDAQLLDLKELELNPDPEALLFDVDGLLLHRLAAAPAVMALIAAARRQGIPVLVDLDDLLFDPEQAPPPLASYAGSIRPEQHRCIQATLPQLQASLRAADQLLFSTNELADRWRAFERKAGRDPAAITVWPNLIPDSLQAASRRPRKRPLRQTLGRLRLVVASASTPHLQAWHEVLAPALAQLLQRHRRLRLDLLGSVPLPLLLEPFTARIRCRGHCDYDTYLKRLAEADIGLMVLEQGAFTDAKSPNRWMECSLMGLATVISPIRSCTELLEHGVHTRFSRGQQDWINQIEFLLKHPRQRKAMVRRAWLHAQASLAARQAKALWDPLLRLQQPEPLQVLLVGDPQEAAGIGAASRLAADLLEAAHADSSTPIAMRQLPQSCFGKEELVRQLRSRRPALIHLLTSGPIAKTVLAAAGALGIPVALHLLNQHWLSQPDVLRQAHICLSSSAGLLKQAREAGARTDPVLQLPWTSLPRHSPLRQGPVRVLSISDGSVSSGLFVVEQALRQQHNISVVLTVLQLDPSLAPKTNEIWGASAVHWTCIDNHDQLSAVAAEQDVLLIPELAYGDELRLSQELLSAGLWLIASQRSNAATLLADQQFGISIAAGDPGELRRSLMSWDQQRNAPEPLLHFPRTQPNLGRQLQTLHQALPLERSELNR